MSSEQGPVVPWVAAARPDRRTDKWPRDGEGRVAMMDDRLDLEALVAEAA